MLKQGIILVIVSIVAVFIKKILSQLLHSLLEIQHKLDVWLGTIFSHDHLGEMIRAVLALIVIPLAVAIIVAIIMRLAKKKPMPHAMVAAWVTWLVLLVAVLLPVKV